MKQNQRKIPITMEMVRKSYEEEKMKGRSAGIDGETWEEFEKEREANLYIIWNRLSSGSYHPPGVKQVLIPKHGGKKRKLGIPTVRDRVAQKVVTDILNQRIEGEMCEESHAYRKGKSCHTALAEVRKNCWEQRWVLDIDIEKFFDSVDHELVMKAVEEHVQENWMKQYIRRWLEAPIKIVEGGKDREGEKKQGKGIPQGGVISPLLANLFLHYALDKWLKIKYPGIKFVRYSDDVIVQCRSKQEAEKILAEIKERLESVKLKMNEEKTKIVYCKRGKRKEKHKIVSFDFLGYTFKPRKTKNRATSEVFLGFDGAISKESKKKIVRRLVELEKNEFRKCGSLEEIAQKLNPIIRGWWNYFSKIGKDKMYTVIERIEYRIVKWLKDRYKRLKRSWRKGYSLLYKKRKERKELFAHWSYLG